MAPSSQESEPSTNPGRFSSGREMRWRRAALCLNGIEGTYPSQQRPATQTSAHQHSIPEHGTSPGPVSLPSGQQFKTLFQAGRRSRRAITSNEEILMRISMPSLCSSCFKGSTSSNPHELSPLPARPAGHPSVPAPGDATQFNDILQQQHPANGAEGSSSPERHTPPERTSSPANTGAGASGGQGRPQSRYQMLDASTYTPATSGLTKDVGVAKDPAVREKLKVAQEAKSQQALAGERPAYSDETARVYRSETARRSDLKAPTIPVSDRPGWCRLVGRFRHVTRAKSGSSNRCQRVCIGC